jgi:pyruvate dehydrogenase E2 component (dihydrolipoamide acetyltransferase)
LSIAATPSSKAKTTPANSTAAYTDIPLTNMRKVIANRLQESKGTIPHYYLTSEITMDKVLKYVSIFCCTLAAFLTFACRLREVFNGQSKDYKLSVNDFVIKASALALKQVPEVNSQWHGEFIRK